MHGVVTHYVHADLTPPELDICIYYGDPPTIEIYAYGVAAWSNDTHTMQVRATKTTTTIDATFDVEITPAANSNLDAYIVLTANEPYDLPPGQYFYDVQALVNGDPTGVTRFRGRLTVEQDVTR